MELRIVHCRIDREFIARHECRDVLNPVYWSVNIYDSPEAYQASLRPFSAAQRAALAAFWYQAEVNNGGHAQFFLNSTGVVWREALAGFGALGLDSYAGPLRAAVARLGGDVPLDREAREARLDAFHGDFDDLDQRFYALDRQASLRGALTRAIRAQPDAFTFDGLLERP